MTRRAAPVRATLDEEMDARARFYDRHGAVAFGLAVRVTGDHTSAERAVEAAFLSHWQQAPQPADGADAEAALLSEVIRHSVARLRTGQTVGETGTARDQRRPALDALLPA